MITIAIGLFAASVAEQMAPAKQGMLQCQMPDVLFKTCASLSRVYQTGPSAWSFDGQMIVDPESPVTASFSDTAFVRGSEICKAANAVDVSKWTFTLEGRTLSTAEAARYRTKLQRLYGAFGNKLMCTEIVPNEQGMELVRATIGGKRFPIGDYAMKWVSPKDGWTVAP